MVEFVEEIESNIRTSFKVTMIPIGKLKEFKSLCKSEYGDIYWVGISELLKTKKKYDELLTLFSLLQNQIDELKLKSAGEKKAIKTFG